MTDNRSTEFLAEQKRLAEAATEGPWVWRGDSFEGEPNICPHGDRWTDHGPDLETAEYGQTYADGSRSPKAYVITSTGYDASRLSIGRADAEFIAAARGSVPLMIAALESVLALHERVACDAGCLYGVGVEPGWGQTTDHCVVCVEEQWPCATYRAVEDALGGEGAG